MRLCLGFGYVYVQRFIVHMHIFTARLSHTGGHRRPAHSNECFSIMYGPCPLCKVPMELYYCISDWPTCVQLNNVNKIDSFFLVSTDFYVGTCSNIHIFVT